MDDLGSVVERLEKAEKKLEAYKRLFKLIAERFRDSDDSDEIPDDIIEMFEILRDDTA